MSEKKKYCSSCKHSKYEQDGLGRRFLHCYQREALGQKTRIPTDCTMAEECLDYWPERRSDALTSRVTYRGSMSKCGIPLEEEEGGVLREVRLR